MSCPHRSHDNGHSTKEEKKSEGGEGGLQEKVKEERREPLPTSRDLFQGKVSTPGLGGLKPPAPVNQRRMLSLEPFHQSSISSSWMKRGREEEREERDGMGSPNKKAKFTGMKPF